MRVVFHLEDRMRNSGTSPPLDAAKRLRPEALIASLLLLSCVITGLLAVAGGGNVEAHILKASFWFVIAGLSAIACIFFWRAARLLLARR